MKMEKKKVLFVATVVKAHIMVFHIPFLKWFKENGYETYVCAKNDYEKKEDCVIPYCDNYFDLPFERSPIKINNLKTYKQLKLIIEANEFDIIHCHTPTGGLLTRLSARTARKKGTKIVYTAHGFHFFKGAPLKNWLIYYPAEFFLARYTDILITINKEDFIRAKRFFRAGRVEYIPGVGIDTEKFSNVSIDKMLKRREIGVPYNSFVVLSVGELNKNKNHETVIRALAQLNNPEVHYVICGEGQLKDYLRSLIRQLGIEQNVHLLGYRKDIPEICNVSDIFAFPSLREGLGLAALEAMASGLPIITSNVHGIVDYSIDGETGFAISPNNVGAFADAVVQLLEDKEMRIKMGNHNKTSIYKFGINNIKSNMYRIYNS
jgi:glycosyltransferase involved in cell wall biosynthesis